MSIDFTSLNQSLLSSSRELLHQWLPGGKIRGNEFICGDLSGDPGTSLSINLNTGMWADFASNDRGGDLVSLYAAIYHLDQIQAAKALSEMVGGNFETDNRERPTREIKPTEKEESDIIKPPKGTEVSEPIQRFNHFKYGKPSKVWFYRDTDGSLIYCVARYEHEDGKQVIPWSWSKSKNTWVGKAQPEPRAIYNLDGLKNNPSKPVLIVEGEKAASAAMLLVKGKYVVTTWSGGGKAIKKFDWSPLRGKKVLIWPDADLQRAPRDNMIVPKGELLPLDHQPGMLAANEIAEILHEKSIEVKIINVGMYENRLSGWDAADAIKEGWDWEKFLSWAKPKAFVWTKVETVIADEGEPRGLDSSQRRVTVNTAVQTNVQVNVDTDETPMENMDNYGLWDKLGLPLSKSGSPICNADCALRVLEREASIKGKIWYDEFYQKYFTTWNAKDNKPRIWEETDTIEMMIVMQRHIGLSKMAKDSVLNAVLSNGYKNRRNSVEDWLNGLKWDGVSRLPSFLIDCLGADDSEYTRSASQNFWVGMVARVFRPGCQLDNMIILEGKQGIGKSKILRAIGGDLHTEASASLTSKDFLLGFRGKLIVEISELSSFKRSDNETVKQIITRPVDPYRVPYGKEVLDHKRQFVFIGTMNGTFEGKDSTGARRFWPIQCGSVIRDDLARSNREQYFAEAVHLFKSKYKWYEMPHEATLAIQESRRQEDPWEAIIDEYLNGEDSQKMIFAKDRVSVKEILDIPLKIEPGRQTRVDQMRVADILRDNFGFGKGERHLVDGVRSVYWYRKNPT